MKIITNIAGALLGLVFVVFALNYFFPFLPTPPPPPAGSPPAQFMGAMIGSHYFAFVKTLEIIGGILVAIPKTRAVALLILGPIVVNILCFHIFLAAGAGLVPVPLVVALIALFLLWSERGAYSHLLKCSKSVA